MVCSRPHRFVQELLVGSRCELEVLRVAQFRWALVATCFGVCSTCVYVLCRFGFGLSYVNVGVVSGRLCFF